MNEKLTKDWIICNLRECVNFKSLWISTEKIEKKLSEIMNRLTFTSEEEETKRELYQAIDHLKAFRDNLRLKPKYQKVMEQ